MNRVKDFVREVEPPVAKRLVQQIVGRGDRSDQGVFDRKTAGVGPAVAHRGYDILHVPAGERFEIRPAPACGSLAERSVRTLNGNTHGSSEVGKKKPRQVIRRGVDDPGGKR